MIDLIDLSVIDWLEVVWVIASLITALGTGIHMHHAQLDWDEVDSKRLNGLLRIWAGGMLWISRALFAKGMLAVLAGVIVLVLPNATAPAWGLSAMVRVSFIGINLLMLAVALLLLWIRRRMIDYREKQGRAWDGIERRKGTD